MNREAEKLQGLLARIERNRRRPAGAAPAPLAASSLAASSMAASSLAASSLAAAPVAAPDPRRARSPSPLEIAVETELGEPTPPRGSQAPAIASRAPQAARPDQHTPAMFPAVTQSPRTPMRNEPMATPPIAELRSEIAAPAAPIAIDARGMGPPSQPIVRSTGTITPARALTFGELIAKTLALRP